MINNKDVLWTANVKTDKLLFVFKMYSWRISFNIRRPFLCVQAEAEGELYVDDGYTFDYKNGAYIYMKFTFRGGRLIAK